MVRSDPAHLLADDDRFRQVPHWPLQAAALVSQTQVGFFLGDVSAFLQDALWRAPPVFEVGDEALLGLVDDMGLATQRQSDARGTVAEDSYGPVGDRYSSAVGPKLPPAIRTSPLARRVAVC